MGLEILIEKSSTGNSLAVQWLRSHASSAGVSGSIPGQGTKIPHACHLAKKKKKKVIYSWMLFKAMGMDEVILEKNTIAEEIRAQNYGVFNCETWERTGKC